MTQEDKELLLKDLCARLPYGVMMGNRKDNTSYRLTGHDIEDAEFDDDFDDLPYLRPMSSMTDEERKELKFILREKSFAIDCHNELIIYTNPEYDCDHYFSDFYEVQDWLNAHYFDYRGLIEKGLAIEAPEGMYEV